MKEPTMDGTNTNLLNNLKSNREFLLTILDKPITFHKVYIQLTGSVTTALMLSHLVALSDQIESARSGRFVLREFFINDIEEETGLSEKEQTKAAKKLLEQGFLQERLVQSVTEYQIDFEVIASRLHRLAENMENSRTTRAA